MFNIYGNKNEKNNNGSDVLNKAYNVLITKHRNKKTLEREINELLNDLKQININKYGAKHRNDYKELSKLDIKEIQIKEKLSKLYLKENDPHNVISDEEMLNFEAVVLDELIPFKEKENEINKRINETLEELSVWLIDLYTNREQAMDIIKKKAIMNQIKLHDEVGYIFIDPLEIKLIDEGILNRFDLNRKCSHTLDTTQQRYYKEWYNRTNKVEA